MSTRKGQFKPGQTGNPKGRPRGVGKVSQLRESLNPHLPSILGKLVAMALDGDVQACRILLERTLPPLRAVEQTVNLPLPSGSLTEQAESVLLAAASGEIAPGQAATLLTAIAGMGRIVEFDQFEARLSRLEGNGDADIA